MVETVRVWGGTHPDEQAAMAVVDSLEARPIPNVVSGIANPLARELGKRFVDMNMVHAFPGDSGAKEYEKRRAVEVLAASQGFDVVVDLHNINSGHGENDVCIDQDRSVSSRVLGFLGALGIRHLIATGYGGLHKYVPNSFVLDTVAGGLGSDVEQLRDAFDRLANDPTLPLGNSEEFTQFRHISSLNVDTVTPDIVTPEIRAFELLPNEVAAAMGYPDRQICLTGWKAEPNEGGYWAELCEPIV